MKDLVETLLSKPYWLIDVLPKQVPADGPGQYFAVEPIFLLPPFRDDMYRRFSSVLLKLNCYEDLAVSWDGEVWETNPSPEELLRVPAMVLLEARDALITFAGDDHFMTLYNPDEDLLALIRPLAASEGLFLWRTGR